MTDDQHDQLPLAASPAPAQVDDAADIQRYRRATSPLTEPSRSASPRFARGAQAAPGLPRRPQSQEAGRRRQWRPTTVTTATTTTRATTTAITDDDAAGRPSARTPVRRRADRTS